MSGASKPDICLAGLQLSWCEDDVPNDAAAEALVAEVQRVCRESIPPSRDHKPGDIIANAIDWQYSVGDMLIVTLPPLTMLEMARICRGLHWAGFRAHVYAR